MENDFPAPHPQRIVPMLAYDDAPAAIDFLCRAFGFALRYRLDMPDGTVGHAEVERDGHIVMLATTWKAAGMATPVEIGAVHSQVQCVVDDVDAHFAHARDAGATIAAEPEDQFHGSRTYRAIDPEGHRWIFSMPLEDTSAKEA